MEDQLRNFYDQNRKHIRYVQSFINTFCHQLYDRGIYHDESKYGDEEVHLFAAATPGLDKIEFGSTEYKAKLETVGPAKDHHYANNRHHIEYGDKDIKWLPVVGYEGLYEVNNKGDVKSLQRIVSRNSKLGDLTINERILIPNITPKKYLRLQLNKEGERANLLVHRLVAEAFIPNPENKPVVNHKDGDTLNTNVENLEWATHSENLIHAYDNDLKSPNAKYVIYCPELDITTIGTEKMSAILRNMGYDRISSSGIYSAMMNDGKHLDLTFEGTLLSEYYRSAISKMNLLDLVEMFCDWAAASKRNRGGDIRKSIEYCIKKYHIDYQLASILRNSVDILE